MEPFVFPYSLKVMLSKTHKLRDIDTVSSSDDCMDWDPVGTDMPNTDAFSATGISSSSSAFPMAPGAAQTSTIKGLFIFYRYHSGPLSACKMIKYIYLFVACQIWDPVVT